MELNLPLDFKEFLKLLNEKSLKYLQELFRSRND